MRVLVVGLGAGPRRGHERSSVPNTTRFVTGHGSRARKANLATATGKVARSRRDGWELGPALVEKTFLCAGTESFQVRVWPADNPFLQNARSKGINGLVSGNLSWPTVSSEGKLIGITGVEREERPTTTLVHHILKSAAIPTFLAETSARRSSPAWKR